MESLTYYEKWETGKKPGNAKWQWPKSGISHQYVTKMKVFIGVLKA